MSTWIVFLSTIGALRQSWISGVRIHLLFLPPSLLPNSLWLYQPFLVSSCHMCPGWQRAKPSWLAERFSQNMRAFGPTSRINAVWLQFQDKKTCFYELSDSLCFPLPRCPPFTPHWRCRDLGGGDTTLCAQSVVFKESKHMRRAAGFVEGVPPKCVHTLTAHSSMDVPFFSDVTHWD